MSELQTLFEGREIKLKQEYEVMLERMRENLESVRAMILFDNL